LVSMRVSHIVSENGDMQNGANQRNVIAISFPNRYNPIFESPVVLKSQSNLTCIETLYDFKCRKADIFTC
jgi:hypothetical protein